MSFFKKISDYFLGEDKPKETSGPSIAENNTRIMQENAIFCNNCNTKTGYPIPDTLVKYKCRSCGRSFNGKKHNIVAHKGHYVFDGTNGRWKQYR